MKRKTKIISIIIAVVLSFGITVIAYAVANNEPDYKLQENIRQAFRPDWVWDESKEEYSNLGDLKRDPDTGLFPEPSPFPKDLIGYAHWDPYLGLYITNSIHIDHQSGNIKEDEPKMDTSAKIGWPEYDINIEDKFNEAYKKYYDFTIEKYYKGGLSSLAYPDMDIFEREGFTPEWFGLTISDLPMVINKLEAGAPPSYTMSLIMLLTKTDVGVRPSSGDSQHLGNWLKAFKAMKAEAGEKVKQGDLNGLGYLALPHIYEELKSGSGEVLLPLLPEAANGLKNYDKSVAATWDKTKWLNWCENNTETLNTLKYVNDKEINMPWLK